LFNKLQLIITVLILVCLSQMTMAALMPYQMTNQITKPEPAHHHVVEVSSAHHAHHSVSEQAQQQAKSQAACHQENQASEIQSCDCCPALCATAFLDNHNLFTAVVQTSHNSDSKIKNPIKRPDSPLLPPIIA
jgi:hypothetical protein